VVALPPSYATAPVTFDLRPVLREIETAVPVVIGSIDPSRRIKVKDTPPVYVAAELRRGPLRWDFSGNTVTLTAVFEYQARAWVRLLIASPSVSCGTGDDPRPRLRVRLRTTYDLSPTWHIRTHTEVLDVAPLTDTERDQCEVSAAHFDVTGPVTSAAEGALRGVLEDLDQKLARVSVAPFITGIWNTLQRPISISRGTLWFVISPESISLGPIEARDSTITAMLSLLASPRLLSGPRPPDGTRPLPRLGRGVRAESTVVLIEGLLLYEAANQLLARALVDKSFKVGWRKVTVTSAAAFPMGSGRLGLRVGVRGRATGTIYVAGRPTYDAATDMVTIPDLALAGDARTVEGKVIAWLVGGPLLGFLRENARIPGDDLMALVRDIANRQINRRLTDGVNLVGRITSAEALHIRATPEGLLARARGVGQLGIEISKQCLVPPLRPGARRPAGDPCADDTPPPTPRSARPGETTTGR
jgi:hypothetical protein